MTIWELVILVIVGCFSIAIGIGLAYSLIVNAVERYQIRKTKRDFETFTKIMGVFPETMMAVVNLFKEEENKKNEEEQRKWAERLARMKDDE